VALVGVAITDQPEERRAANRDAGALYDNLPSYRAVLDREGVEGGADLLLLGSADRIEEGLARYVDAGVTDFRIGIVANDDEARGATRAFLTSLLSS
ncbi:MAG: LLM class F420-dependent oxidoreductase, partial [Acidimicrobiales bacterium]